MATDTSTHLYNSLLALSSRTSQDGLLSAFSSISHTVEENAKNRKERSRAALDAAEELSPAQEFLEEAKDFSETVDKAKDAMLDHLKKEYEATYTTAAGRMSGSAYGAIWTAYVIARLARTAAVSAMDAKASEVRAAYASKTAATALKPTAESSAADAKGAASVARSAAEQSSALAVQAAASALDLLKKLRDSGSLAEKIDKGIKELEAIEAIKGAATSVVGGILLDTEGKAAEAEKAARSAASAADAAVAVAGTTEKAEGAAQKVEGEAEGTEKAGSAKEEIVNEFLEELDTLKHTNDFLGQSLEPGKSVREKLPKEAQDSLSELESFQERKLKELSKNNDNKSPEELLAGSLDIMRKIGQARTDLTREHLLKLNNFKNLEQLDEFLKSPDSAELGLFRNDLELRRENLKKRETVIQKSSKCLYCAAVGESEFASGEEDSTIDLRLTVKCILNNTYMKAVVDTGAACNIVSDTWINNNKLDFPPAKRHESLLMGNGSVSDECPCLTGLWKFTDKGAPNTVWKDVEFVKLKGHQGDALLGLPFLKLTQIIHSSTGQLLFTEYEEVPRKEGAPRPIYFGDGPVESNEASPSPG